MNGFYISSAEKPWPLGQGVGVYLIWDKKQVREGLTLVTYTALWLMVFVVNVMLVMAA